MISHAHRYLANCVWSEPVVLKTTGHFKRSFAEEGTVRHWTFSLNSSWKVICMIIGLVVESTSIRMVNRQGTEKLDYWPKVCAHYEPPPEDCPLVIRSDFLMFSQLDFLVKSRGFDQALLSCLISNWENFSFAVFIMSDEAPVSFYFFLSRPSSAFKTGWSSHSLRSWKTVSISVS